MNKQGARVRIQRLIAGARYPDDLTRIFIYLRSRSHGERLVKEIGNFSSHHDRRDQGMSWRRAGNIHHSAKLFLQMAIRERGGTVTIKREQYERSMLATLDLIGPSLIRKGLRMTMKQVERTLASALAKMAVTGNAEVFLTKAELLVLNFLHHRFRTMPAFSGADLVEGLIAAMTKEELLTASEQEQLRQQAGYISTYAISLMHHCELDLGLGDIGTLQAGVGEDGNLCVALCSQSTPQLEVTATIFETGCDPRDWCSPDCEADFTRRFTFVSELDLDERGRLREL